MAEQKANTDAMTTNVNLALNMACAAAGAARGPGVSGAAAGNTAQLTDRWDEIETTQGFSLCSVTDGGIDVTYVLGDDQSADESDTYGPGGHPTLQARDYSIAPEQPPLAPDPWLLES